MPTLTWIQGQATGTVTFDDMKSAKLGLSSCGAKFWDHMDIKIKINGAGLVLELQQALGVTPDMISEHWVFVLEEPAQDEPAQKQQIKVMQPGAVEKAIAIGPELLIGSLEGG